MGQPVKLSNQLLFDARLTCKVAERSRASQIEFWASLGRSIEPLLRLSETLALRQAGAVRPISACLEEAGTPVGNERVSAYLASRPFPHYEVDAQATDLLVRIERDVNPHPGSLCQSKV